MKGPIVVLIFLNIITPGILQNKKDTAVIPNDMFGFNFVDYSLRLLGISNTDKNLYTDWKWAFALLSREFVHVRKDLLKLEAIQVLRTHIEFFEAMTLCMYPLPPTVEAYKELILKRNESIDSDLEKAINGDIKAYIVWPKSLLTSNTDLKDAIENRVNRHFRNWMWLLYRAKTTEINAIRNQIGNQPWQIRELASGIASIYMYASTNSYSVKDYTKAQIYEGIMQVIEVPSFFKAAKIILENTWVDK